MELAARMAAWAKSGGGVPTAKDYVQDGLIAMWDGIENAGWGVHDPNATTWKDLSETIGNLTMPSSWGEWEESAAHFSANKNISVNLPSTFLSEEGFTAEVVYDYETASDSQNAFCVEYRKWGGNGRSAFYTPMSKRAAVCGVLSVHAGITVGLHSISGRFDGTYCRRMIDGVESDPYTPYVLEKGPGYNSLMINGLYGTGYSKESRIHSVRLYERSLSSYEVAANYAIDKARFKLPDVA